jgi:hypothetical protein
VIKLLTWNAGVSYELMADFEQGIKGEKRGFMRGNYS